MSKVCKCPNCGTTISQKVTKKIGQVKGILMRAYEQRLKRRIRYDTKGRNERLLALPGYQAFDGFIGC